MKTRVLVGILGLSVLLPLVIWGGVLAVEIIVAIAWVICLDEYSRMAFPDDQRFALAWLLGTGALSGWAMLRAPEHVVTATLGLVVLLTFIQGVVRPLGDLSAATDRVGRYLVGLVWIVGLLPSLARLRGLEHGVSWVVLALAIGWLGDTGAYFAGRSFGRRKLYELVSPKKTWEGVFGGMAAVLVGTLVMRATLLPTLTLVDCAVIGTVGSATGVLGDLFESLLKRAYGVKDSGWVMPGHGGLLDRIDSVLFVGPFLHGYIILIHGV